MEYKSVDRYLSRNKKSCRKKGFFYRFFIRLFVCILIVLGALIFITYDKNHKQIVYKYFRENNITFASINEWYKQRFGDIVPFQNLTHDKTKLVFNENLIYKDASIYRDGVKLNVDDNYLIPIIKSGIVVFIGDKDGYGKTVIIEQVDGVDVWYGNVDNINVSLYDYVSQGEFLANANKSFYMVFCKNGKYIKYQDYLK